MNSVDTLTPRVRAAMRSVCGQGCTVPALGRLWTFAAATVVAGIVCYIRLEELELNSQAVLRAANDTAKFSVESAFQYLTYLLPDDRVLVVCALIAVSAGSGLFLSMSKRYRHWRQVLGAGLAVPTTLIGLMVMTVKVLQILSEASSQ